jgi:hypothetical protein
MPKAFDSSRRKIARAKDHIDKFDREVAAFMKTVSYESFSEPDAKNPILTVHKVRMNGTIPEGVSELAGDAIGNLREALDHAAYAVAIAGGCADPKAAYFPFSGTSERFESSMRGRCKDIPEEMYPVFRSFEPWSEGNDVLYTLNQLAIRNKHTLLIPFGAMAQDAGMDVGGTGYMSMPDPHFWNHAKNEMELITLGPDTKFKAHFRFFTTIAFSGINIIQYQPATAVLLEISREVQRVVAAIEDESRRLGYIS